MVKFSWHAGFNIFYKNEVYSPYQTRKCQADFILTSFEILTQNKARIEFCTLDSTETSVNASFCFRIFSPQKADSVPTTYCELKCQGNFGHRCAVAVTPFSVTLLPDLGASACFTKRRKKTAFSFNSLFPLNGVTEKISILKPFLILSTQAACPPLTKRQRHYHTCICVHNIYILPLLAKQSAATYAKIQHYCKGSCGEPCCNVQA